MSSNTQQSSLDALRDALADLYPTEADWRTFVASVGLQSARITAGGNMHNTWRATLEQARVHDRLEDVMRLATKEYPRYRPLQQACADCRASLAGPVASVTLVADPTSVAKPLATSLKQIKAEALREQLAALTEQYRAANRQLTDSLDEAQRVRLRRQMETLEREMSEAESDLNAL